MGLVFADKIKIKNGPLSLEVLSEKEKEENKYDNDDNIKTSQKKPSTKKQRNGKHSKEEKIVNGGKRSLHEVNGENQESVHLRYQQRNGRKGVTTIVGLPTKVNFKKLLKKMKNKFSTGATLANDEQNGTVIQIQGDLRHEIVQFIIQLNIVEKSQITVH